MKCVLVKSDSLNDWYCIERAVHDGREWDRKTQDGYSFMRSARLGEGDNNYCIEGTAFEMNAIATAIETNSSANFKRCAVEFDNDAFALESPRNSVAPVYISVDDAKDLAANIKMTLKRDSR